MAASTRSRLSSGSPMPMNTMLVSRLPVARRGGARRGGPGRRSRRPRGPARTRARRSRRTGSPTAQPAWLEMHSVCRSREPRPRRVVHQHQFDQRAVGQPVERLLGQAAVRLLPLGVGDGVEPERGVEVGAQGGGQRPDLVDRARPTPSRPHRRPGGRGRRLRRARPAMPRGRPGVRPDRPGRSGARRGSCRDASAGGHGPGSTALPAIDGRPRRNASHGHPPATGRLDLDEPQPLARADAKTERRRTCRPAGPSPIRDAAAQTTRRPNGVSTYEPGHGWYARTWRSSSTAGRPGSSRPSPRRSGRVSVAPRSGWGRAAISPRSHGPTVRSSSSAPCDARIASSTRRRLVAFDGQRSPGRRSARCRARRPSG